MTLLSSNKASSNKDRKPACSIFTGAVLSVAVACIVTPLASAEFLALEEVIVTAQKRAESLQDTPIAITAFTSDALLDKGINDISELAQQTPNLVFDTASPIGGAASAAAVFIRGVGNTDFSLTTDPGVGTYVDGVYVSRSIGGVLDVLDVERIEVLRGPQGTLFGRNTIGGALSITTRKPAEELEGSIEMIVGNEGRRNVRASIDLPISDTLRTNFAISSKERDGFVRREADNEELGNEDKQSVRGTAYFEPNDTWDAQLTLDYTKADESSSPNYTAGFSPGLGVIGIATQLGITADEALVILNESVSSVDDPRNFGLHPQYSNTEVKGTSFITNLHLDNHDIKYTFAFRETESQFSADTDASPFVVTDLTNPDYQHEQTSHELQFTGNLFDDSLKYAAGLYLFEESGRDLVQVPVTLPPIGFPVNADFSAFINNYVKVDNESEAAYFQTTYDINDTFSTTFGVRHTKDTKEFNYAQFAGTGLLGMEFPTELPGGTVAFPAIVPPGTVPAFVPLVGSGIGTNSNTFSETQYKFGVDATLDDGTLLYYSYSEGFKSGGFVLRYVAPRAEPLTFEPETLTTHEVGMKWQSVDNRHRVNIAVYSSDYEQIQVTLFDGGGGPVTANAGNAEINGVELEWTGIITDNLRLELGYGYTDAEYTSLFDLSALGLSFAPGGVGAAISLDSKLVNAPKQTLSFGLEYTTQIANRELVLRADYSYTDEVYNDSQNSPFLYQDDVSLLNLSARLALSEQSDLVAYAENVTDERYIITGNSNFGLGFHSPIASRPREMGLTYRFRF